MAKDLIQILNDALSNMPPNYNYILSADLTSEEIQMISDGFDGTTIDELMDRLPLVFPARCESEVANFFLGLMYVMATRIEQSATGEEAVRLPEGHPERQPGLMIARRCTNTIREMNDYRYPSTASESGASRPAQEKPVKKDDHTPEALGRFFVAHHRPEGVGARITRANLG